MQRQKLEHAWVTGTNPIHQRRSDDPASKSSPPDSPSSLRSIPLLSRTKKRSHISIVRQRRRPSSSPPQPAPPRSNAVGGRRGAAAAQITAPPVLSDAAADVVLLIDPPRVEASVLAGLSVRVRARVPKRLQKIQISTYIFPPPWHSKQSLVRLFLFFWADPRGE